MQRLYSLGHLFSYSWASLVSALDTNTFAIILSVLIIVVSFSAQILFKWLRRRRQGATVKQVLKERLEQSVLAAIHQEQKQLRRTYDLRQTRDKYKTEVQNKDKEIDE